MPAGRSPTPLELFSRQRDVGFDPAKESVQWRS
jgi:hypothetical protein